MAQDLISNLSAVGRPLGTDLFESESASEGSVKYGLDTLLDGPQFAAITQLQGYTVANVAEVEGATDALRVTFRPLDLGLGQEKMFSVTHHAMGVQTLVTATTVAINDASCLAAMWPGGGAGFALLNKFSAGLSTGAVVGARAGVSQLSLRQLMPVQSVGIVNNWWLPPIGGPPGGATQNYSTLRGNQLPPNLIVSVSSGAGISISGLENSKSLGDAMGRCTATVGETNIPMTPLFDAAVSGYPYVMVPFTGFNLNVFMPAAVTSQSNSIAASFQWDEWVPITQF